MILLDSHHAPRARKHVRNQLKELSDVEKQIRQHESMIKRNEALISKLSDPGQAKQMAGSLSRKASNDEIQKLQDSIRKEEMEILAIDQLTQDLQKKVCRSEGSQKEY
jgi:predicted  nucleic acid-binding Zn-ribbon protein